MKSAATGKAFVAPEAFDDDARRYVATGWADPRRFGISLTACAAVFICRSRLSSPVMTMPAEPLFERHRKLHSLTHGGCEAKFGRQPPITSNWVLRHEARPPIGKYEVADKNSSGVRYSSK